MKKVYLVVSGWYSDLDWAGWCSTEEEARRVVAVKNRRGSCSTDEFRYEACECLDGTVEGDVCAGWSRLFDFYRVYGGWKVRYCSDPWVAERHAPNIIETGRSKGKAVQQVTRAEVRVWQKEDDKDRAEKAALDALYEYVAKKEGVAT